MQAGAWGARCGARVCVQAIRGRCPNEAEGASTGCAAILLVDRRPNRVRAATTQLGLASWKGEAHRRGRNRRGPGVRFGVVGEGHHEVRFVGDGVVGLDARDAAEVACGGTCGCTAI